MTMERRNHLVTGLIAGAAVGAVAGLLLAPKPGKVTRRFVVTRARRKTNRYVSTIRRTVRKGREMVGSSDDKLIIAG